MHKYELLRQRAEEFHRLLEKYAKTDRDVADYVILFEPWYERIQRRKIRLPCYEYQLDNYFVNPDLSPLAERYRYKAERHPLSLASAHLSESMVDWLSSPAYLEMLKKQGREPSAILDEPPPPEEEAPLAREEPPKPGLLARLSRRGR